MTLTMSEHEYTIGDTLFEGRFVSADSAGARPVVLVFHGWEGRSDAQVKVAERLAAAGYAAFACDLFGKGVRGDIAGDNSALIAPLLQDRELLRERLLGNVAFVRTLRGVDAQRVAAIGFCFGGLCALDLARAGTDVRAVASFHGVLGRPERLPIVPIQASILVLHGWLDPLAIPTDVTALGHELSSANADWQIHAYGNTMHAFMAVGVERPEAGLQYNARSAKRAWAALEAFLTETLAA